MRTSRPTYASPMQTIQQLRHEVIKGCRQVAKVYLELERENHPLEEEVCRALGRPPKMRQSRGNKKKKEGRMGGWEFQIFRV